MASENGGAGISLQAATKVLDRRVYPAGSVVFSEGDTGNIAYILLRGDVTIVAGRGTENLRVLTEIKPGQMFGELALMAGSQRTASAVTKNGCELLFLSQEKLKKKLDDADPFLRYWIEYLSKRVIDLSAS